MAYYEFINKCISKCEHSTADWTRFARCLPSFFLHIRIGIKPYKAKLSSLWQWGHLERRKNIMWLDIKTDKLKPAGPSGIQCSPRGLHPHRHSEYSGRRLCKFPKPWHERPSQLWQIHPKFSTGNTRQHHIPSLVLAFEIYKGVKGE